MRLADGGDQVDVGLRRRDLLFHVGQPPVPVDEFPDGADGVGSKVRDSLGFKQDRWVSTDGIIRLIVPRHKDKLGDEANWDNTIDMWNFEPRVQRILYSPCNKDELYLGLMAPAADPRGSRVPLDLEVWVEMFPFLEPCLVDAAKLQQARYDKYATTKLDSWVRGKVALVGDSAHAMCPALAGLIRCRVTFFRASSLD